MDKYQMACDDVNLDAARASGDLVTMLRGWVFAGATALVTACDPPPSSDLIFVNGRAVAAAGDSLLAYTMAGEGGLVVMQRGGASRDTLGRDILSSPFHVQEHAGHWFVSDVADGRAGIVELTAAGELVRRRHVDTLVAAPHQFALLPDGRIVLESPTGILIALAEDSVATFAIVTQGTRTGLLVAVRGGVLHAAPGQWVTFYNANGNIRWRLTWPWGDQAFVGDLGVDAQGRPHVIAGEQGTSGFVVFSLSPITGEVVRWSEPGPYATFAIDRLGDIEPRGP